MKYWITKDKRKLLVTEMETEHIKNCIKMLKRAGYCSMEDFNSAWAGLSMLRGEMALYYAEQEVDTMTPHPAIDVFEMELAKRKN